MYSFTGDTDGSQPLGALIHDTAGHFYGHNVRAERPDSARSSRSRLERFLLTPFRAKARSPHA